MSVKYKVSERHLARKASAGKWSDKRREFRKRKVDLALEAKLDADVLDKKGFDRLTDFACDGLLARLAIEVNSIEGDGTYLEPKEIASTIKILQEVKYRRLDIPVATATKITADITNTVEVGESTAELIQALMGDKKSSARFFEKLKKKHASDSNK